MDDQELLGKIRETIEDTEGIERVKEAWRVEPENADLWAAASRRWRKRAEAAEAKVAGFEDALRAAGIEHPLTPQGVEDLAAMAEGRLEDLRVAEAQVAAAEALADEWERDEAYGCREPGECLRCLSFQRAVIAVRAALAPAKP